MHKTGYTLLNHIKENRIINELLENYKMSLIMQDTIHIVTTDLTFAVPLCQYKYLYSIPTWGLSSLLIFKGLHTSLFKNGSIISILFSKTFGKCDHLARPITHIVLMMMKADDTKMYFCSCGLCNSRTPQS